ncbi:calcium-binding protein [Bradyrhizobium sp. CCBAU 51753]|uniref:beta strand repeat-containing protein n=1 Tax=Bradyrhizobium sp. CCBAU 51753 TaxID=1325100 RepID=UPI00188C1183|nr:calcium-binding protein [Bradyrhizobium sp. CCBAU 51753]QOZ26713.1 hypothetical protein XH93_26195 [Bradyrhizobium sp. CCBAU 51753]
MPLVQGTDNPEVLNGTPGDDTITGLKGDDILNGLGGADLFVWSRGDGADTVNGGDGSDTFQATIPYYGDVLQILGQFTFDDTEKTRIEVDPVTGHVVFDSYILHSTFNSHEHTTTFTENGFKRTDLTSVEHLQIIGGSANSPSQFTDGNGLIHTFSTDDSFVLPNLAGTGVQDVSLDGGSGNDVFDATAAGVSVAAHGGDGNDILNDGSGNDTLFGDAGNDTLRAGGGLNTLVGGTGDDVYFVNNAADTITELSGEGSDAVFASSSTYTLSANVENLFYAGAQGLTGIGNAANNWIQGGTGSDYLIGLDGNDVLYDYGGAPDALQGGRGDDTYIVEAAGDGLIEFQDEGHDRVLTTLAVFALGANLEDLTYSGSQNFAGSGNELANSIDGGSGNDFLTGAGGNNVLNGGAGSDTADYSAAPAAISVSLATGHGLNGYGGTDTYTSIENIVGSNNDDTIIGDGGNNTLNGGGDADSLIGGGGDDTLIGGAGAANTMQGGTGNDRYVVQAAGDSVKELANEGTDLVETALATYTLPSNVENLTHTGSANFTGAGNELNNVIIGGAGNDYLIGGAGDDTLIDGSGLNTLQGGQGNDIYAVQSNADTVFEFANEGVDEVQTFLASYTLPADVVKLTFIGSASHVGVGNSLSNTFTGGPGDDIFYAGVGGNDIFNYRTPGNGFDDLKELKFGDIIDLSGRGLAYKDLAVTETFYGTVVGIPGGDAILMDGILKGQVSESWFRF